MRFLTAGTAVLAWGVLSASAQTGSKPEFEVATVKPAAAASEFHSRGLMAGGPGSADPGRLKYDGVTLRAALATAYGVKPYQISGPAWMDTERFDISAKVPVGTNKEQFGLMLQNLLAERFQMAVHRDKKELPAYSLFVGKGGPKLKPSTVSGTEAPAGGEGGHGAFGGGSFGRGGGFGGGGDSHGGAAGPARPGISSIAFGGFAKITGTAMPVGRLATALSEQLDRAVVDETGIHGNFDFVLQYEPDSSRGAGGAAPGGAFGRGGGAAGGGDHQHGGDSAPPLFTAIQEQLGLKLEAKKAMAELIVVDRAEKTPTGN